MAATMIKVWAKINGNEPEKVAIRADSDIDDLKSELFIENKEEKRHYYGSFNNERLASSTRVPHDTTCERPILFVKIDENDRQNNSDDMDTARITTSHLNTVPDEERTDITFITYPAENVSKTKLSTTPTTTVSTSTAEIIANHLPPHPVDTKHYKNGDKYVGEVNEKGEPHGKGTMSWKNGRRYEGYWKNGKKDGQGVEYGANGAVNYNGEWNDDTRVSSYQDDEQ